MVRRADKKLRGKEQELITFMSTRNTITGMAMICSFTIIVTAMIFLVCWFLKQNARQINAAQQPQTLSDPAGTAIIRKRRQIPQAPPDPAGTARALRRRNILPGPPDPAGAARSRRHCQSPQAPQHPAGAARSRRHFPSSV
jgi:hypothetical protein